MSNDDIQISMIKHTDRGETTITARFNDMRLMRDLPDIIQVRAAKLLVEKYVEDKYQEISAKIDTDAIAKQLVLAVSTALADKAVTAALSPQPQLKQAEGTPAKGEGENTSER